MTNQDLVSNGNVNPLSCASEATCFGRVGDYDVKVHEQRLYGFWHFNFLSFFLSFSYLGGEENHDARDHLHT